MHYPYEPARAGVSSTRQRCSYACWMRLVLSCVGTVILLASAPTRAQVDGLATSADAQCTRPQTITHARRIATRGGVALDDRIVALPDRLPWGWRNEQVALRYTIDLSDCARSSSAALSVYRVGAPFVIQAHGIALASLLTPRLFTSWAAPGARSETTAQPAVFNGRIPNLFGVPPGARSAEVTLLTLPYIPTGLAQLELGPTNALMPAVAASVERSVAYTDAAAGVILVLAVMAGTLWLHRRHDMGFLWMTLACLCWSVRALAYFDRNVYLPPIWFEQLNPFNILLTAVGLSAATLATMGPRGSIAVAAHWRHRSHQALVFALVSGSLAITLSVLMGSGATLARAYVQLWALALSLAIVWWIWARRVTLSRQHRRAAIAAFVGLIACAVHDMALVLGAISTTGPAFLFWGFTAVLVVYALICGDYIVSTLNRAENSNLELEQRVTVKSAELEDSYQQLRKTEMARAFSSARLQERERLLRDMHDGLGAQLMTALRGVERAELSRDQIVQSLQQGMDELRMLMDSADMGSDLSGALAAWRNRWDSRLGAAGVQLHWHLDDSIDGLQMDGDILLQIMRILQEAATNVVKHAQASNLYVQARQLQQNAQTWLVIVARDDGRGLPQQDTLRSQRGLRNMGHRAAQIGARFDIANPAVPQGGCQMVLELRLRPPPDRPERRRYARTAPDAPGNPGLS
ncbi:MAG: ATP-binding protein [Burkholderiaceae bacterium]